MKYKNNLYFDPIVLSKEIPNLNFLISIIINNYVHFFTKQADIREFFKKLLFILEYKEVMNMYDYQNNFNTDQEAKILMVLNTIFSNQNVNMNVNIKFIFL